MQAKTAEKIKGRKMYSLTVEAAHTAGRTLYTQYRFTESLLQAKYCISLIDNNMIDTVFTTQVASLEIQKH